MELKWIFYMTINRCNGDFYFGVHNTNPEVFDGYIGCSIYRQSDAERKRRENNKFANAVIKYGYENFQRTTIREFPYTKEGRQMAFDFEGMVVTETLLKSKHCLNTRIGGEVGNIMEGKRVFQFDVSGNYMRSFINCEEAAINIPNVENINSATKAIRNCCLGASKTAFGFVWSYEREFKKANMGKPVAQYTLSGKFLRTFESIKEAETVLHIRGINASINETKKGRPRTAGNYQWRWYENDDTDIQPMKYRFAKSRELPIIMCDMDGNNQAEYECVRDCVKANPGMKTSLINRVLDGSRKSHMGHIFKYKVDDIV